MERVQRAEREFRRVCRDSHVEISRSGLADLHQGIMRPGGKLLRPRLVMLCTAATAVSSRDVDWGLARRAALAIELAHIGTLYHDDLVDRSPRRRGVQAVHRRAGVRAAALGGAHLLALANSLAAQLPKPMAKAWGAAALRVADGQARETENAGNLASSSEAYLAIARKKTASLFELAATCGGIVGCGLREQSLVRFARHFGTAFQLFDDLNDFVRLTSADRPEASDLRARIYTLPVILTCQRDNPEAIKLRTLLADDGRPMTETAISEVVDLLHRAGGFAAAARYAMAEREEASRCLQTVSEGEAKRVLEEMLLSLEPPVGLIDETRMASHC